MEAGRHLGGATCGRLRRLQRPRRQRRLLALVTAVWHVPDHIPLLLQLPLLLLRPTWPGCASQSFRLAAGVGPGDAACKLVLRPAAS